MIAGKVLNIVIVITAVCLLTMGCSGASQKLPRNQYPVHPDSMDLPPIVFKKDLPPSIFKKEMIKKEETK